MSDTPKSQRSENQGTFFLYNKRREATRAHNEDQMLTSAMGGPLAEQADATVFQRVLNIACGSGDWIIEAAQRYPHMFLVGIDNSAPLIDYARENAVAAQVEDRVTFQVMDALRPLDFPTASFDLINLRLGVTFIRTWEWPELLAEMIRIARPGGVIRLTEPQIIHQNKGPTDNPALKKLHNMLICSLYRSGHLFEENTTGITSHLVPLLTRYGCKDIQTKAYALEFRSGTPQWQDYHNNAVPVIQGSRLFITKWGCMNGDFEALQRQAIEEILKPDFHLIWNFLTVWGKTPPVAYKS